jgi:hypothetical protein
MTTTTQHPTVRFYYASQDNNEYLVECVNTQKKTPVEGWEITRIEPDPEDWFEIQELDIISQQADSMYTDIKHRRYSRLGRYFSDEAELAIRELEDARESWAVLQYDLDDFKLRFTNARIARPLN